MKKLNIVFAGTPDFAVAHLKSLLDHKFNVVAVCTQPDGLSGRGQKLKKSPVKILAEKNNITVYQPSTWKTDVAREFLISLNPDVLIVVAYGLILPQTVLDVPTFGCINVHASLLPRWRGAAPIQRAIAAGDTESGITIMQMDSGLDTGDMLMQSSCPISPQDTAEDLHDRLVMIGQTALIEVLNKLGINSLQTIKQDEEQACYAAKITRQESVLDWNNKTAQMLAFQVRAFIPWPVTCLTVRQQVVKIWFAQALKQEHRVQAGTIIAVEKEGVDIACQEDVLRITKLQMPGGRVMTVSDFLNGRNTLFIKGERVH